MEEVTANLWAQPVALFGVDYLDCATKVSSLLSIIDFPGVPLFLHVQHRRHHFLHTQHFPPQHLPKDHLNSRAGSAFKRPRSQNWHVPKQHSSDSACKPRPGWPACVLSKCPRVVPVLFCVTLGEVGVVRTVDRSDKPKRPAPVATGPLGLLHAPSCVACASGVAVGQRRSFTRKCRAAARSSLSAPTHKTQLLPLALAAQPRVGHQIASQTLINARPFVKGRSANLIKWN